MIELTNRAFTDLDLQDDIGLSGIGKPVASRRNDLMQKIRQSKYSHSRSTLSCSDRLPEASKPYFTAVADGGRFSGKILFLTEASGKRLRSSKLCRISDRKPTTGGMGVFRVGKKRLYRVGFMAFQNAWLCGPGWSPWRFLKRLKEIAVPKSCFRL